MTKDAKDWIKDMRRRLTRMLSDGGDSKDAIVGILENLEKLEDLVDAHAPIIGSQKKPPAKRRPGITTYGIEAEHGEPVLTESRPNTPHPFRVERSIYDATASALHGQHDGLQFDATMKRVESHLGYKPAEYLVRVCLRYWLKLSAPIVKREHSRYAPVDARQFKRMAANAWEELAKRRP